MSGSLHRFGGDRAIEYRPDDTGQVGPEVAALLDLPFASGVRGLEGAGSTLRQIGSGPRIGRHAAGNGQQDGTKDQHAETRRGAWEHAYFWLVMSWKDGDIAISLAKAASEIMSYPASLKCTPSV